MIIFGTYKVARKQVAYANSFCRNCETSILAQCWRYFSLGHLFYIPLIPLGFRREWICPGCGEPPLHRYRTGRTIKWLGFLGCGSVSLLIFSALFADAEIPAEDIGMAIRITVVSGLIAAAFLWSALKHQPIATKRQILESVPETGIEACAYCQQPLKPTIASQPSRCEECALDVLGKAAVK